MLLHHWSARLGAAPADEVAALWAQSAERMYSLTPRQRQEKLIARATARAGAKRERYGSSEVRAAQQQQRKSGTAAVMRERHRSSKARTACTAAAR